MLSIWSDISPGLEKTPQVWSELGRLILGVQSYLKKPKVFGGFQGLVGNMKSRGKFLVDSPLAEC